MIPSSAERYRDLLAGVFGTNRSAEGPSLEGLGPRPPEIELQSRWFAGDFGRAFTSTAGRPVEIVQFGEWNRGAGPDFREVVVNVAGRKLAGTLELDWDARDWERHGHAQNPGYDGVVLHVFFDAPPGDETFFTRTSRHQQVAQVRLDLAALTPARLTDYAKAEAKWGRCSFPLRDLDATALNAMLESAARHRLLKKARRLQRISELHGWDQALFQEIAAALGYRRNKLSMTVLAQRLPWKFLASHRAGAESLLFGVAGFLETKVYEAAAADTKDYLRGLWEGWWKHRAEFAGTAAPRWITTGSRPLNHPQRRIGALALVALHWRKIRAAFDQGATALQKALAALEHPYWDYHFTLTSPRSPGPMAVLGATRIRDILANLAFPYASLHRDDWWPAYAKLGAPLENEKSRRAALRLLGQRPDADKFTRKIFQQQALIQIYEDFCLEDHSDCEDCLFPEQLRQWE